MYWIGATLLLIAIVFPAFAQEDITLHKSCPYCGMDREKFAHSRVYIEFADGSTAGICSLHCAAIEMALNIDKTPKTIWVGDYATRKLVDIEKAYFVLDVSKPGVMTGRAKWAFANRADAENYIRMNGGVVTSHEEIMKASYEDLYQDTKTIRERRKMKRAGVKR
jgi:nitrous oxide reductase accessory protein NosL